MKADRDKIWKMFGCKCAYCGNILESSKGKDMHIDHIEPLVRLWNGSTLFPDADRENNLFPCCPPCNNYKHSQTLEDFRYQISMAYERLENSATVRNAKRFGIISKVEWDKLFWFEKYKQQISTTQ